jgi:hypothetical protein
MNFEEGYLTHENVSIITWLPTVLWQRNVFSFMILCTSKLKFVVDFIVSPVPELHFYLQTFRYLFTNTWLGVRLSPKSMQDVNPGTSDVEYDVHLRFLLQRCLQPSLDWPDHVPNIVPRFLTMPSRRKRQGVFPVVRWIPATENYLYL